MTADPIDYAAYGRFISRLTYEGGTAREQREERQRLAADVAFRADVQHSLVCAGDPRGIYGDYPPATIAGR